MPKANNPVIGHCRCHGCEAVVELRESVTTGLIYYTCDGRAEPSRYCNSMMKYGRAPSAKIREKINGYRVCDTAGPAAKPEPAGAAPAEPAATTQQQPEPAGA